MLLCFLAALLLALVYMLKLCAFGLALGTGGFIVLSCWWVWACLIVNVSRCPPRPACSWLALSIPSGMHVAALFLYTGHVVRQISPAKRRRTTSRRKEYCRTVGDRPQGCGICCFVCAPPLFLLALCAAWCCLQPPRCAAAWNCVLVKTGYPFRLVLC